MNKVLGITAIGLVLFTNIVFTSCQKKILMVILEKKNPIEYIYNSHIDSLHSMISQVEINNKIVWDAQHANMVIEEVSNLLSKKGNSLDFCLEPIPILDKSKIYLSKYGDSLDFHAWFYLHLESIDDTHTKVSITTIEPEVIVGREILPSPPHFVRLDKKVKVEPSTIEEYEILLKIGKLVQEKDMPLLILPNERNKVETIEN